LLVDRAVTAENSPLSVVDTFAGRALIHGGTAARGYSLTGTPLFEVPLGDFTLSQAAGVRLSTDTSYLALVGSTDRDSSRYRLAIVRDCVGCARDCRDCWTRWFSAARHQSTVGRA
jgi:hypothetical protein